MQTVCGSTGTRWRLYTLQSDCIGISCFPLVKLVPVWFHGQASSLLCSSVSCFPATIGSVTQIPYPAPYGGCLFLTRQPHAVGCEDERCQVAQPQDDGAHRDGDVASLERVAAPPRASKVTVHTCAAVIKDYSTRTSGHHHTDVRRAHQWPTSCTKASVECAGNMTHILCSRWTCKDTAVAPVLCTSVLHRSPCRRPAAPVPQWTPGPWC